VPFSPCSYPSQSQPHLYARSSSSLFDSECSRRCNELLSAHVASLALAQPEQPDEREVCVVQAVHWMQEQVPALLRDSATRQAQRPGAAAAASANGATASAGSAGCTSSSGAAASAPLSFQRELILFHHIYSSTKRRAILDAARSLHLTGAVKSGKPGFVVVEGEQENVREWIAQIKQLSWQRMTCKLSQVVRGPVSDTDGRTFIQSQRKFASFHVLAPLAGSGAQWPTMTQLIDLVAPLGLQEAVRDALGLGDGASLTEDPADDETRSDDDAPPADAAAASAPPARKLDKRSQKEAEKRLARQMQQVQISNAAAAAVSSAAAASAAAPAPAAAHSSSSAAAHRPGKGHGSSGKNASTPAPAPSPHVSDLACVEVLKQSGASSSSSSSSSDGGAVHSVKVHVRAKPGASCSELLSLGDAGEAVHLALAAPPREGAANAAAIKMLAQILGVQTRQVELVGGDKSRDKTFLVKSAASPAEICARLRALCPPALLPPSTGTSASSGGGART
jgi:uncharacterized protein (TIGR00251 family)